MCMKWSGVFIITVLTIFIESCVGSDTIVDDNLAAEVKRLTQELKRTKERLSSLEALVTKTELKNKKTETVRRSSELAKRLLLNENSNAVGFSAVLTHDVTLGPLQTVEYNKILTNIGNGYDNSHGHFTTPVKGLYIFAATSCSISNASVRTEIILNGNQMAAMYGDDYDQGSHTIVLMLEVDDQVWVRHFDESTSVIHSGGDRYYSSFSGVLIASI